MKIRLLVLSLFVSSFAFAADIKSLAPTVVTATRVETNSFDLPVSIDVVEKKDLEGQLNMTLSESLIRIPGITAQNRTQMAQDPQISTRGFGARSTFGVRGIRVYVDDIPLSTPDGIATPGNIDIGTLKSIEVMRGPFSSLYGSSSGGVINLRTQNAPKDPEIGFNALYGSYNTDKELGYATGTSQGVEYLVNYSRYSSDGYRDNSENEKEAGTIKLKTNIAPDTKLTMLFNWIDQKANDPGGLTSAEVYGSNRKMSSQNNIDQKARVSRDNKQVGFNLEHKINDHNAVNLIAYVGERNNLQYLYSAAYIGSLSQSGRASAIARDFHGTDLRWTNTNNLMGMPYQILAGISYGYQKDKRTDDMANNGVKSANPTSCGSGITDSSLIANCYKLRDENNIAYNFDQYFQGQISATKDIDIHAGVRSTFVTLKNEDSIIGSTSNTALTNKYKDGSGKITARKTTPVIGMTYKVTPTWNIYGNYGEGFETPTFIEMAYSDTTGLGPNFNLKPSTSENYELGTKFLIGDQARANIAIFKTDTNNELVSNESTSAYTSYKNAGKTQRKGLEISLESALPNNFNIYGSYSYLDAEFKTPFQTSYTTSASGICPSTCYYSVSDGNKISGTYKDQLYGELTWKHPGTGFSTSFETRANSKVFANDSNTVSVAGYTVFNIRAGFEQKIQGWRMTEYLRVENLADKDYIGSIKNNENTGRYFEPSAGRNYLIGISASYQFK
jgi:iron complex outermembrane receptor protein